MNVAGDHPGDELSALLDGELELDEAIAVRTHVEGCPACTEELHALRATRLAVRTLPGVDPASGVMAAMVERLRAGALHHGGHDVARVIPLAARRRRAGAAASVAATVALVVLGLSVLEPEVYRPGVSDAVDRHAASVEAMAAGGLMRVDAGNEKLRPFEPVTPTTAPSLDLRALPAPFSAPEILAGGYRLVEAFAHPSHPEGLQLVYEWDGYALSVFETPGQLDFDALPAGGKRIEVGGADGWRWESPQVAGRVVVYEQDGLVVTVVGDEPGEAVLDAARSIPPPRSRSLGQRLGDVGAELLEALGP